MLIIYGFEKDLNINIFKKYTCYVFKVNILNIYIFMYNLLYFDSIVK